MKAKGRASESRRIVLEILLESDKQPGKGSDLIKAVLDKYDYLDARDKAFIKRLSNGCMERSISLDHVLDQFSSTKTKKMKKPILYILRMGVYQILYMDGVFDGAACNEAVYLAQSKGFAGLKGFVNGVLRNISRKKDEISWPSRDDDLYSCLSVRYSVPMWIVKRICDERGADAAEAMFKACDTERPVCVNTLDYDTDKLKTEWESARVKVSANPYFENAAFLSDVPGVSRLYGFDEGKFIVQDTASILAVFVCGIKKGDTVIDLCAAPGGKSLMASNICGKDGKVFSYDISESKVDKIRENAARLKYDNIFAAVHDASVFDEDLVNKADVVIADLPCSGLGVMGRKPDIRFRLKEEDIDSLACLQRDILKCAAQYVKPGGVLLFSTCTVSRAENEDNRSWFLENTDYEELPFYDRLPGALRSDSARSGYLQLISGIPAGEPLTDGFFISLFRRKDERH